MPGHAELDSNDAPGALDTTGPADADPVDFDLVCLAMQEPQYRFQEIKALPDAIGTTRTPCMSIMNMPPLPFLARIARLDTKKLEHCYKDPSAWQSLDPDLVTLASPDPQAFRPPDEPLNVLQVSLPTNFKVARFASEQHTSMLRRLEADIEAIRVSNDGEVTPLPVKIRVHDSVFVTLAKWAMLLTGNYRCVQEREKRLIAEVAKGLSKPSSAARTLAAGAPFIETVDALVKVIANLNGMSNYDVDNTVDLVDAWLTTNRETC